MLEVELRDGGLEILDKQRAVLREAWSAKLNRLIGVDLKAKVETVLPVELPPSDILSVR